MNELRTEQKLPIPNEGDSYNHFILTIEKNLLIIKHMTAWPSLPYTEIDMEGISIKVALIPQLLQGINQVLFTDIDNYEFFDEEINYSIFVIIDNKMQYVRPLRFYQTINDTTVGFKYDWSDGTVDYVLENRVYPAGIYWLIDTLKKIYNDWQKVHLKNLS